MSQFRNVDDGSMNIVLECRDCLERKTFPITTTDVDTAIRTARYNWADYHECVDNDEGDGDDTDQGDLDDDPTVD